MGGNADGAAVAGASNVLNQLVTLLLAEKAGMGFTPDEAALAELDRAVHAAAKTAAGATNPQPDASKDVDESATGAEIDRA